MLDPLPDKVSKTTAGGGDNSRATTVKGVETKIGEKINMKEQQAKIKE